MALVVKDRVRETSTTTGTGAFTLGGAVTGFRTFASVMSTSDTTFYTITMGADWECGVGTYSGTNTLTRPGTVLAGSNGTSPVNFGAGTKDVFMGMPAGKVHYDGMGAATFGAGITIAGAFAGATTGAFSGTVSTGQVNASGGVFPSGQTNVGINAFSGTLYCGVLFGDSMQVDPTGHQLFYSLNGNIPLLVNGTTGSQVVRPNSDNLVSLGAGSFRWTQLFAGTTTISTSWAEDKILLGEPDKAFYRAILSVPLQLFQYKDAVAEKGEKARKHYGPTADDVVAALEREGLDPWAFAMCCRDEILRPVERVRKVTRPVPPEIVREKRLVVENGRATLKLVEEARPVMLKVPVIDEETGEHAFTLVAGAPGYPGHEPDPVKVPLTAEIEATEEIDEEYEEMEPTGEYRLGLRLDHFEMARTEAVRLKLSGLLD